MHSSFVRRSSAAVLVAAALALSACSGDVGAARLKQTHSGMPRDSVMEALGTGVTTATGPDTTRLINGQQHQVFLLNGQQVDVIWYRETPASVNDSLTPKTATPVVFMGDTLAGWGWKYYLGDGAKLGLRDPRIAVPAPPAPSTLAEPAPTVIPDPKK